MKFRKKPVEVEAFQMTFEHHKADRLPCGTWPVWLFEAYKRPSDEPGALHVRINTGRPAEDVEQDRFNILVMAVRDVAAALKLTKNIRATHDSQQPICEGGDCAR